MDMTEPKKFERRIGKLKLSEAMRIGAMIRPQCYFFMFNMGKSCALGATYEGATGQQCGGYEYSALIPLFPSLGGAFGLNELAADIYRRNDSGQTREQIADWLESQGL